MKRKYGLVGYPLGHSFSRSFFQQKFEDEHINATYENFEIQDISCLRQLISDNHELCGLNVTIPHKTAVIPLLDELHPLAREIGAVNVIKITRQGDKIFLKGFNSDIIGFTNSIAPLLDDRMTKALILGTGGASKAIHAGLKALHITPTFVSRQKRGDILSYEDLSPDLIDNHNGSQNLSDIMGSSSAHAYQHKKLFLKERTNKAHDKPTQNTARQTIKK